MASIKGAVEALIGREQQQSVTALGIRTDRNIELPQRVQSGFKSFLERDRWDCVRVILLGSEHGRVSEMTVHGKHNLDAREARVAESQGR